MDYQLIIDTTKEVVWKDYGFTNIKLHVETSIPREGDSSTYVRYTGPGEYEITIGTGYIIHAPNEYQYYMDRHSRFLNGLGIAFDDYVLFTLNLLHEIGHIHFKQHFIHKMTYIQKYEQQASQLAITYIKARLNLYERRDVMVNTVGQEAYAEKFAYENFMYIWNALTSKIANNIYGDATQSNNIQN